MRKLFKVGDKLRWLFLELVVVFIGVYLAFLFQNYSADRRESAERQKVFSALKSELEFFRTRLPGMASYTFGVLREQRKLYQDSAYRDFSGWRFLEPQYEYQIIEYSTNLANTNIIDFQLYDALQALYSSIKRLENAERLMMETAHRYRAVTNRLPSNHPEIILRNADNFQNFKKLAVFTGDRARDQQHVARNAVICLEIINARMDQKIRKSLERNLILAEIDTSDTLEAVVKEVQELFPNFTEEEIAAIYQERLESKSN